MTLTTVIDANVAASLASALDLVTASAPLELNTRITMPSGTTSGKADLCWSDTRTVAASSTDALDLAGTLAGVLGGTLTIVKLKAVLVRAAAANVNNVRVNRPASNGVPLFLAASDGIDVLPGGLFLWVAPGAGVTVTAATGDLLNIDNSGAGTSVTYDVVLVGTSA
ncbi:hypothetical protein ACQPZX_41430 [Actinoplanes sp. CA-142083]|uniref:hypothetical protein n=1 Tax=Actinoplanes sp. CA-142083 TaxID=3239903 RepID=UPI003D918084